MILFNIHIYKYLSDLLIKYETSIKQDIINYYIQNFKKEKMKLKISESKKNILSIDELDKELIKEFKKKYEQVLQEFNQEKFKEEIFTFFVDFFKKEIMKIINENTKEFKIEDLKPSIEKNLCVKDN